MSTVNGHGNDHRRDMGRPVTIRDVARRAGVSRQTVSRAINNKAEISAETRERVLQVVREMGYRPSSIARGLKTDRTLTIGLVVPDIANPFFAEVARGASEVAYGRDYSVLLCNTDEQPKREWGIIQMLEAHRIDGLLLISSRLSDESLAELAAKSYPLVLVNRLQLPRAGTGCVLVDDAKAALGAVRYLREKGHRSIGFLAGTRESRSSRERRRGYREAMGEATDGTDLAALDRWCAFCAPNVEGGRDSALALLRKSPELTALLAYNDLVAVGAEQACAALGRAVPQDCAVVGWDDIIFAAHVSPPLTTMRMPKYRLGERAMYLLLDLIGDPQLAPEPVVLEAELIVRASA